MSRTLAIFMTVTDVMFLLYWSVSALVVAGVIHVPPELMYAGYGEPRVMAWNWSFLPPDIAFSITGLLAVRAARRGDPIWRPLAIVSLTITVIAGTMAIGYWALLGEFDPSWFLPNLALAVWPLFFLPGLICAEPAQPAT